MDSIIIIIGIIAFILLLALINYKLKPRYEYTTCSHCHGSGMVKAMQIGSMIEFTDCYVCNGIGQICKRVN